MEDQYTDFEESFDAFPDDYFDNSSLLNYVNDDIEELKIVGHLDACIKAKTLDEITLVLTTHKHILDSFFTKEQMTAMSLVNDSVDITVKINDNEIILISINQNNNKNLIEKNLVRTINQILIASNVNYVKHKIPYDISVIEGLTEIGDIGLCIFALLKYKNRIDDACEYISNHLTEKHDALDLIMKHNNLAFIVKTFYEQLSTICSRCILCGKQLNYKCIKPTVCDDVLCQMQLSTIGVDFSLENEILNNPIVSDLLISLFIAIFETNKTDTRIDNSYFKMFDIKLDDIKDYIMSIPSISDMKDMILKNKLNENLSEVNRSLPHLLRWILSSNMSYLTTYKVNKIPKINCDTVYYSFIMKTSTPEKDHAFEEKKKQFGTTFLFHGSQYSNWYLIIKNGLKNYSNTQFMTTGAAYGQGIYLSDNQNVALQYCRTSSIWRNSVMECRRLMALCEVAKVPELKNCGGNIFTLTDETAIITRYLLVV